MHFKTTQEKLHHGSAVWTLPQFGYGQSPHQLYVHYVHYDLQARTFEDSRVMLGGMSYIKFERVQILMVHRI